MTDIAPAYVEPPPPSGGAGPQGEMAADAEVRDFRRWVNRRWPSRAPGRASG